MKNILANFLQPFLKKQEIDALDSVFQLKSNTCKKRSLIEIFRPVVPSSFVPQYYKTEFSYSPMWSIQLNQIPIYMKNRNNQNQTRPKQMLWLSMLSAVMLCLFTSLSSFGQTPLSMTDIQNLQLELNQTKLKMANPFVASNATVASEYTDKIASLTSKISYQKRVLNSTDPVAAQTLLDWISQTEETLSQNIESQNYSTAKTWTQSQIDAQNAIGGNSNNTMIGVGLTPPSGTTSFDPTKTP